MLLYFAVSCRGDCQIEELASVLTARGIPLNDFERLDTQIQKEIDRICDDYESKLDQGESPTFDSCLSSVDDPNARRILFVELVGLEIEHVGPTDRAKRLAELRERFPEYAEQVDKIAGSDSSVSRRIRDAHDTIATGSDTKPKQPTKGDRLKHRTLGQYELLENVGSGAFGDVWRAHDNKLNRAVAIKLPRTENLSETGAQRFLREAQLAAQLKHPNIVAVHEIGQFDGTPFIVSDFIAGQSVSDWKENASRDNTDITRLCIRIADALHHAHEAGIIHRDLKPSNILVDGTDKPHLTDFGLAKDLADDTTTIQGNVLGSPAYMSPEQARGDAFRSDRRTDVYSLGVLLYEMLTGQRPFQGAADAVLHQVIYEQATRPRRISDDIPIDLETICLKAISKEPASRYETAQHMADDLQRYLNGEPISARSMSWAQQGWRWCVRNRALSAAIATAVGMLVFLAVTGPFVAFQMKKNADAMAILSRDTRRSLYVSDMSRAYNAWENLSNYRQTKEVLDKYEPVDNQEELRGFEWYLLRTMTHVENRFETGHSINGLDVSPDGRLVAVTGPGSTALWNLETRKLEKTLDGPVETGRAIAFSPDGMQVVSNDLTTVRIWTVVDGKLFLEEPVKGIWSVDFSPDGASIALGLIDGSVRLMDIKSGEQKILGQHVAPVDRASKGARVYHLTFSQDGSRLLSTSWTGRAKIWNLASNDGAATLPEHEWWARQGAFSPDGSLCATTDVESIKIWNSQSGQLLTTIPHFGAESVAFSADGQTIACGTWLNEIRLFNLAGKALSTLRGHSALVHAIAFSANGHLVTGGKDGVVCSWDSPKGDGNQLVDIESSIRYAAISNDARFAVLTCEDGSAHVIDADTGGAISKLDFDANRIRVAISPDDGMLAFNDGKEVLLKRYPSLKDAVKIPAGPAAPIGIAFSPDGETLAVGDAAGKIVFRASDTGNQQSELQLQVPEISSIAYSMEGELIGASGKKQVQYWSITTPEKPTLLEVPDTIREIRFSPDGKLVAAACQDSFIYLWHTQDGSEAAVLRGHGTYVMSLAFATDGRTLVSGSADANIKFWNLVTMEEMISIRAHAGTVTSLNFSADGKTLMSTGWGRPGKPATAVLWRIE